MSMNTAGVEGYPVYTLSTTAALPAAQPVVCPWCQRAFAPGEHRHQCMSDCLRELWALVALVPQLQQRLAANEAALKALQAGRRT